MITREEAQEYISCLAQNFGKDVLAVSNVVLTDPRFPHWSGSSKSNQHHYGESGLLVHTAEVIKLGFTSAKSLDIHTGKEFDELEWFFAALFHDTGKMYDYAPVQPSPEHNGPDYTEWKSTDHKRLIHHISRSGLIWSHAVEPHLKLKWKYHDKVLHAILAHHGQREWGSPVAPRSRIAWMPHLCDGISARMNDCNSLDYLSMRSESKS